MRKVLFLFFVSTTFLMGQNPIIDSLQTELENEVDLEKIALLHLQMANQYERIDLAIGKQHALQALSYTKNDTLYAETTNQLGRFYFFTAALDSAAYYFNKTKVTLQKLNKPDRVAAVNISLGAIMLRNGDYNNTIETLTQSATYFETVKDSLNMGKCYSNIATAFAELDQYPKAIEYSEKALYIFNSLDLTQYKLITLPNLANQYLKMGDSIKAIQYNFRAEEIATKTGDKRSLSLVYGNLGNLYLESNPTLAKSYLQKTLALKTELKLEKGTEIAQSNLGYLELQDKNYSKAILYFESAIDAVKGKQRVTLYNNLTKAYDGINDFKKALFYSEKARKLQDSILNTEVANNYLEIQTKYETEKKEREILALENKNQETEYKRLQNRNLLIAATITLIVSLIVLYLIIKNHKRKQIIATQDAQLKEQIFEQQIKVQELNGIDAILQAQEKERSKIAADLHDNLGSKVATLKLYIDDFNSKDNFEASYEKLKNIVDETYSDIRKIGSSKSFGALINKGLIPSTQAIAGLMTHSKKITIKVINVDVDKRIENTIEIQIFRIIQELLTNIIKHSAATEAVIQFSEHENTLNIIVEDNGKGFRLQDANVVAGVGLTNIEKRVEQINGEFVIDSTLGHGTTVILNIPL